MEKMKMTVKCKKCSMNEQCICIPSSDECFVRIHSYNKAIEDFVKELQGNAFLHNFYGKNEFVLTVDVVDKIAKQLKS